MTTVNQTQSESKLACAGIIERLEAERFLVLRDVVEDTIDFAGQLGEVYRLTPNHGLTVSLEIQGQGSDETPVGCLPKSLSLHTDHMVSPKPPKYVLLHCIRQDPLHPDFGISEIVVLDSVLDVLRKTEKALYKRLKTRDAYFAVGLDGKQVGYPIIDDNDVFRYDSDSITDPVVDRELSDLIQSYGRFFHHALATNECLLLDNHRVLHSRGECTAPQEGSIDKPRKVVFVGID